MRTVVLCCRTDLGTVVRMGTKKELEPVDHAVAEILAEAVEKSGLSYRDIREATGISINRIGIILRKVPPPATVGEIDAIAENAGLSVVDVITEASARVSEQNADVVAFPFNPESVAAMKHKKYGPKDQLEGETD